MTVDELIAALQKLSANGHGTRTVYSDAGCEIDEIVDLGTDPAVDRMPIGRRKAHMLLLSLD